MMWAVTIITVATGLFCDTVYFSPFVRFWLDRVLMIMLSVLWLLLQYLFQQLGVIIAIVKLHIRSYLDDIFELIKVCVK